MRLVSYLVTVWNKCGSYKVAHVDIFSGLGLAWAELVCWALRLVGKPYALTLRGGNLPVFAKGSSKRIQRLFNSAAAITAPSMYLVEQMRPYRKDIVLLPNPLDIAKYSFSCRDHISPNLVWLRSFCDLYNPLLAIRTLALLAKDFPTVKLLMIGPEKAKGAREATAAFAHRIGVLERITFAGPVPKEQVPQWLQKGDIFLNTSRIDNTPISVLEAMACGLCVVSTNVGGIPYILENERNAILVPNDDHASMARAVSRLITETGIAKRLSVAARGKVEEFDWAWVLPKWESLFTSVAEKHYPHIQTENR